MAIQGSVINAATHLKSSASICNYYNGMDLKHRWISSSYSYRIEILGRSLQDANNRFNVMIRSNTHGYQNISAHTHEIPEQ